MGETPRKGIIIDSTNDEQIREYLNCKGNFFHFLDFVKIVDAPTKDNPGGVIKFEFWEHLKKVAAVFLSAREVIVLKARQIGLSWLTAAYVLWYALFHEGAMVLLFSKGEKEAFELLAKCHRIYDQLPSFMRPKLNPDSSSEMGFPSMRAALKALPSTEASGISFTASIVVCDEWEEHPYAVENYFATKPTRDAGGQFIGIFTRNYQKTNTLAQTIFKEALAKKNDFIPLFFPWDSRPNRDKDWYEHTKRNIPEVELGGLTRDLFMAAAYPSSRQEALAPSQTTAAFDLKVLDEMMGETKNPIKKDGIDNKIIRIYQDFHLGEYYVAASDTSHGVGKDYSVTVILNTKSGAVVADIFRNDLSPEEFAFQSIQMLNLYKDPIWFPEDNDWGKSVVDTAVRLEYKHLGYQDDKKKKPGYHTGKNRMELWAALIPAINSHQITIFNPDGIRQLYHVIRNIEKEGRIEAAQGENDDYPIALAVAWVKRNEAKGTGEGKPFKGVYQWVV